MNIKQLHNTEACRKTAQNLLTEVSRLVEKAGRTADPTQRHKLYLRAMEMSNEAYGLLGKARNGDRKRVSSYQDFRSVKE